MNEIVKQDDLILKVSEQFRPYILALRTQNLKDGGEADNLKAIYKSIIMAGALAGYSKIDDNGANKFMAEKFYEQVKVKYPHARHGEIELAFNKGALKEYGDYFGLNVQTLWGWFKKYQESPELLAAKREWIGLIEAPITAKPVLNLKESMKEPILNAFKEFQEDKRLPFAAPSFYRLICQLKGVKSVIENKELRQVIRKEAFDNYRNMLVSNKKNVKDRKQFDELLEWAMKGINPSYDSEARKVALKYYFEECITNNVLPI